MPIQQPYSGFASLKKWQILVYKDNYTTTYGIIVAKIEIYKRIRVYEMDSLFNMFNWKNYFEHEIKENMTVIDPNFIEDAKLNEIYESLKELIEKIKEENNIRVEDFGGNLDSDSDSEEDNYKPFSDEGRKLFKLLPRIFELFLDRLNDQVWVEQTEKYSTSLTKPEIKIGMEEEEILTKPEVEEEILLKEEDELKPDMYLLFNLQLLNTGKYAIKHKDDPKDISNGVYNLFLDNGTVLKNQIYHLSAKPDTVPVRSVAGIEYSIDNKDNYDELKKNEKENSGNMLLVENKFSMLKHQIPDIVENQSKAWDSASDSDDEKAWDSASDSDEEDQLAPKWDSDQDLNISYTDFINKLHTPGESFYMPVITVDNKKRQEDSEKKFYPYVNPYKLSAKIKDRFREEVATKYSTPVRAGYVVKDYHWPEYMDAYRKWKDTGDQRDEMEQFNIVYNDDNMNYFNYPYIPTEDLGNIPRQDPQFMESESKNDFFPFGATIKLVLINNGIFEYDI